jgi:hypothetical protein
MALKRFLNPSLNLQGFQFRTSIISTTSDNPSTILRYRHHAYHFLVNTLRLLNLPTSLQDMDVYPPFKVIAGFKIDFVGTLAFVDVEAMSTSPRAKQSSRRVREKYYLGAFEDFQFICAGRPDES